MHSSEFLPVWREGINNKVCHECETQWKSGGVNQEAQRGNRSDTIHRQGRASDYSYRLAEEYMRAGSIGHGWGSKHERKKVYTHSILGELIKKSHQYVHRHPPDLGRSVVAAPLFRGLSQECRHPWGFPDIGE